MVIVCNCVAPPLAYRASILLYRAGKTLIFPPPLNRLGAGSVYFTVCRMFFCSGQACRDRVSLPALARTNPQACHVEGDVLKTANRNDVHVADAGLH